MHDLGISVQVIKNQRYSALNESDGDKQSLDLYLPRMHSGFPVLMFIHGGSWVQGDKSEYTDLASILAGHGLGVAVVNYRLSPRSGIPPMFKMLPVFSPGYMQISPVMEGALIICSFGGTHLAVISRPCSARMKVI